MTTQKPLELILARNLMSALSTPAFLVDEGGVLVFYNEAAGALLGKRFEELGTVGAEEWGSLFGPFDKAGEPIQIPPEPKLTVESIKRGKEVFQKMECWKCHGQEGRGDGPSAATLTDSFDQPIRPYDFAQGTRFKCGTTNQDLYKIFMTGLDGTPMPSFASVIKPEEAWDLVHYLRTLQVSHASPELALWKTTPEGAAFLAAEKVRNTPTGSGLAP